jgi:fatty-acyl-CoA synthase
VDDQPTNYVHKALDRFAVHGEAEAMVYEGRRLSHHEMGALTLGLAASLRRHGLRPNSTVAVLVANSPATVALQLAMHLLGCRSAWMYNAPRVQQVDFLSRVKPDVFIYEPEYFAEAGIALAEVVAGLQVLCLGEGGIGPDLTDFADAAPPDLAALTADVTAEPESLFQTSGTTGRPKLVHHKHLMFHEVQQLAEDWLAEGKPVRRHLSMHRLSHVGSQLATFMVLFMGGTVVMSDAKDSASFFEEVARERITSTVVSPPMLYELVEELATHDHDTSSLTMLSCAGAPIVPARLAEAIDRFGPVLHVVYGMSESPLITQIPDLDHDPEHPERLRSCGAAYDGVKVQVRGPDGTEVGPGEVGDVWVTGMLVMAGYWDEPELNAHSLVDGWLRTRDVGYLDSDGYLYLVDRSDDVIVTGLGSINIYTRPVEDLLIGYPGVRGAAVVKVPDDAFGEAAHAYVVLSPGAEVTAEELLEHVTEHLNSAWAPREIEFIDELPRVGLDKVDKKALYQRFMATHAPAATT